MREIIGIINGTYELRVEGTLETEFKYDRDLGTPSRATCTGTVRVPCELLGAFPGERTSREGYAGSLGIALRVDEAITWLLSDHLSSTTVTVDATGNAISMLKYTAYGELRTGTSTTDYQYTLQKHPGQAGQRSEAEIGLYFYVARFYDPQLARFRGLCAPERSLREGKSADTIIPEPNSIKGYDRYAYVNGNPINYTDPSGHRMDDGCLIDGCEGNRILITHTLYLGGFPFVLIPTDPQNYSQKAEQTYSMNEDKVNAVLGAAGLVADALEQGHYYRRSHNANDVEAFISFNELEDGSISITSLTVWNNTDWTINVDTISINSFYTGTETIIGTVEGNYSLNPPKIVAKGFRGVANASPQSRTIISLTPSNPNNPRNIFSQNHHIDVGVSFRAVDFNYDFLHVELVSFNW
jgi:RHS repeat-associated protein